MGPDTLQLSLRTGVCPEVIVNKHCNFLKLGYSYDLFLDIEVCEVSPSSWRFPLEYVVISAGRAMNQADPWKGNPLNAFSL